MEPCDQNSETFFLQLTASVTGFWIALILVREFTHSKTRFGYFWNILASKLITKVAWTLDNFWALVKIALFKLKCFGFFWGKFEKIGRLLIPTSGHTGFEALDENRMQLVEVQNSLSGYNLYSPKSSQKLWCHHLQENVL